MNIADAAHKTVKEYPGGAEALGVRIGMSGAVLRNKVNPNNGTHHLSLAEASEIMGVTGDDRILHALAAEHGYVLRRADAASGGNVVSALLTVAAKQGELAKAVSDSLDDGQITPNESQEIARICASIQAHAAELAARAETASTGPQ